MLHVEAREERDTAFDTGKYGYCTVKMVLTGANNGPNTTLPFRTVVMKETRRTCYDGSVADHTMCETTRSSHRHMSHWSWSWGLG